MKSYKFLKASLPLILFQLFQFSSHAQPDFNMPSTKEDTIAISNSGAYLYQGQLINNYGDMRPLLYHFPETEKLHNKTRLRLIGSALLFTSSALNLIVLNIIDSIKEAGFETSRDLSRIFGNPPPKKPKSVINFKTMIAPIVMGVAGFKIAITNPSRKRESIIKFNELVKSTY